MDGIQLCGMAYDQHDAIIESNFKALFSLKKPAGLKSLPKVQKLGRLSLRLNLKNYMSLVLQFWQQASFNLTGCHRLLSSFLWSGWGDCLECNSTWEGRKARLGQRRGRLFLPVIHESCHGSRKQKYSPERDPWQKLTAESNGCKALNRSGQNVQSKFGSSGPLFNEDRSRCNYTYSSTSHYICLVPRLGAGVQQVVFDPHRFSQKVCRRSDVWRNAAILRCTLSKSVAAISQTCK